MWTRASVASDWVNAEAMEALDRKVLIPVLLEDVQLPLVFRPMQCCDLRGWPERADDKELMQLLRAAGSVLQRPVTAAPRARRRLAPPLLAGSAAILVAGLAAALLLTHEPPGTASDRDAPAPPAGPTAASAEALPRLLLPPFQVMERDISGEIADRLVRTGEIRVLSPADAEHDPDSADVRLSAARTGAVLAVSLFDLRTQRSIVRFRVDARDAGLRGTVDEVARRVGRALGVDVPGSAPVIDEAGYLQFLALRAELSESPEARRREEILEALEQLTRTHPRFAEGFAALCSAYAMDFRTGADVAAFEEAEGRCNRAARLDPDNPWVATALGNLYRAGGQLDEAAESFEAALDQSPYLTSARVGLARVAADAGDRERAFGLLETALDQEPNNWGIHASAAHVYFEAGRYREAARAYEAAVNLSDGPATMLNDLGSAYFMLGERDRAIASWRRSVEREPTASALTNLGSAHYFAGDFTAAAEAYAQAAALAEDDYRMWINAGEAATHSPGLDAARYFERAVELAEAVWRVNPDAAEVSSALALANASLGRDARARALLADLSARQDLDVYAHYDIAVALVRLGEKSSSCEQRQTLLAAGYPRDLLEQDATFTIMEKERWCE